MFSLNASRVGGKAFSLGSRHAPFRPRFEVHTLWRISVMVSPASHL